MIGISNDDYIIADYKGKPTLLFVLDGKTKRCVVEKTLITDEPEHLSLTEEKIHCNLGKEPQHGKVYGIEIAPYIRTIETKKYGPIHFFRKLDKKEMDALKKSLKIVHRKYEEKASVSFLPLYRINIYPEKGKYAGSYQYRQKGIEGLDEMNLHPQTFSDITHNVYIFAHEFAHGYWYRCVPTNIRAKWVCLYQKRLNLSSIGQKELDVLYEDICAYEGKIQEYCKEVGDERVNMIMKEVFAYFKRYHHMDKKAIELLFTEKSDKLAELWPNNTHLTEERQDISEYSLKNVEEFFAEAMANFMTGKILPKDVQKGIDHTLLHSR